METTNSSNTNVSDSTVDQSIPTPAPATEKTEAVNEDKKLSTVEEYKNKKTNRLLTFIGLQVALFLSALDR